jgi:GT2 family glycosyltransferase
MILVIRILCKIYEVILRFYTFLRLGWQQDPSKILIDFFTPEQAVAQRELDLLNFNAEEIVGDLLVVIPFRDRPELTIKCLDSLSQQKFPEGLTLRTILVDNNSELPETKLFLESVKTRYKGLNIAVMRADYHFNYSRLNNEAVSAFADSKVKWLLFLNNDVEFRDLSIIARMTCCLEQVPRSGVIGSTLLYPDHKIQHVFAAPGVKIIAAHPLKGKDFDQQFVWFQKSARPVSAVTGAVMMVRKIDFEKAGGFDEDLPTLGQDVILCLKIQKNLGLYSVSLTSNGVIHHEGKTKKSLFPAAEIDYIYEAYNRELAESIYFSDKLSRWSERPVLKIGKEPNYPVKYVT